MEMYHYKAVTPQGRVMQGSLDAVNVGDLELRLSRMGMELVNYREVKARGKNMTGRGIKRVDLINFCFHLEQLADLRDSMESRRLREICAAMVESIQGGKNLSQALGDFPQVFDNVFVNLVRVGEEAGQLPEVLRQMTENLKWADEQAEQTKKLFMYPAFVFVVVTAVLFFLMIYLVPQLLQFIKNMGQQLPLHTRILVFVSNVFVKYWYLILGLPVAAVVGVL